MPSKPETEQKKMILEYSYEAKRRPNLLCLLQNKEYQQK